MSDHEETAKRLLPCLFNESCPKRWDEKTEVYCVMCTARSAVAAALAEADSERERVYEANRRLSASLAEKDAEIERLEGLPYLR